MCGVCVGKGGLAFYYTYIYSQKGRPCEVAELVGVLVGGIQVDWRRVCVYYCRTYHKAVRVGGGEESGGHVL